MKLVAVSFLVLCAILVVESAPAQKAKPRCDIVCSAVYDPVCGGSPNDKSVKPRLFSSKCVLELHNCEHKSNLVVVDSSRCSSSQGIRLS